MIADVIPVVMLDVPFADSIPIARYPILTRAVVYDYVGFGCYFHAVSSWCCVSRQIAAIGAFNLEVSFLHAFFLRYTTSILPRDS